MSSESGTVSDWGYSERNLWQSHLKTLYNLSVFSPLLSLSFPSLPLSSLPQPNPGPWGRDFGKQQPSGISWNITPIFLHIIWQSRTPISSHRRKLCHYFTLPVTKWFGSLCVSKEIFVVLLLHNVTSIFFSRAKPAQIVGNILHKSEPNLAGKMLWSSLPGGKTNNTNTSVIRVRAFQAFSISFMVLIASGESHWLKSHGYNLLVLCF